MDGFEGFAKQIAKCLGVRLTPRQEKLFCDGEPYVKSIVGKKRRWFGCLRVCGSLTGTFTF